MTDLAPEVAGEVVISADTHAGASILGYRPYLASSWHEEFDAWAAAYESPWDDVVNDTAARNWDSELRREQMEADGVAAEVIFPNTIPPFFPTIVGIVPLPRDADELHRRWAGLQAHNRWLVDFCQELPDQRRGLIQVFPHDLEAAVAEVRWAASTGVIGGVLLSAVPPNHPVPPLFSRHYDPLWAVCEEAGLAVATHTGSGSPEYPDEPAATAVMFFEFAMFVNRTLAHLIIGGVFERFPGLRYTMTEQGVNWVVEVLDRLEAQHDAARDRPWLAMFVAEAYSALSLTPWEYLRRNCFVGATSLRPGEVAGVERLGVDNVMWGSDYPHSEATTPYSTESLRIVTSALTTAERRRLLAGTAAAVYGFDLERLTPIGRRCGPTATALATPLGPEDHPRDHEWFLPASLRSAK